MWPNRRVNGGTDFVLYTNKGKVYLTVDSKEQFLIKLTQLTGYLKKSKVKQVMADLALSQVSNRCVENLTKSEYRRLIIGVQLIKDPSKWFILSDQI